MNNPDEAAVRGTLVRSRRSWRTLVELNTQAKHTQFADFHGHGWVFRAVFKKDRKGNLLDHKAGNVVPRASSNEQLRRGRWTPETREARTACRSI